MGAANNEREVIDFDLQFENNEVMDIWGVEYNTYCDLTQLAAFNDQLVTLALFEDPDKLATTDLSLEATFEDDSSLVHYFKTGWAGGLLTTSGQATVKVTDYLYFQFPQPYTVARNIAVIGEFDGTEGDANTVWVEHVTIWGRRRIAPDAEFKNIIYRQRF